MTADMTVPALSSSTVQIVLNLEWLWETAPTHQVTCDVRVTDAVLGPERPVLWASWRPGDPWSGRALVQTDPFSIVTNQPFSVTLQVQAVVQQSGLGTGTAMSQLHFADPPGEFAPSSGTIGFPLIDGPGMGIINGHWIGSLVEPYGAGCDANATPPSLDVDDTVHSGVPAIGHPLRLQIAEGGTTPIAVPVVLMGFQSVSPPVPLPPPLLCDLHVVPDTPWFADALLGFTLAVPANSAFVGLDVFWQGGGFDPGGALLATNGLRTRIGQ